MLEEICKALAEETNIRENLIELKKSIKNHLAGHISSAYNGRKKEEKPGGCANIHLEEEKLFLLLERFGGKEILPDQEREITDSFMQLLKESLEENQKKNLEK